MFTCQDLYLERNGKIIFSNLGFSLQGGACLIIKGDNGSGKTSLLRTLASIFPAMKGNINYYGIDIRETIDEYRYLINYIGHDDTLSEELTVIENLNFWARMYDSAVSLPAAVKTFVIEEYLDYPVNKISKGMKRKVLLTKLLLNHASIWLLDEPFVNLDEIGVERLQTLISVRCSQGGVAIISTNHEIKLNTPLVINMGDYKND